MYIPFNQLPARARIWIYQAARLLSEQETTEINKKAEDFVTEWASHGQKLQASGAVFHSRFLVLATDEEASMPSGCSIDASVQFVRSLEKAYNVNFFDRTKLLFLKNEEQKTVTLADLRTKIKEGGITADTLFFDNLLKTAGELETSWIKPAGQTWLSKYF